MATDAVESATAIKPDAGTSDADKGNAVVAHDAGCFGVALDVDDDAVQVGTHRAKRAAAGGRHGNVVVTNGTNRGHILALREPWRS